MDKIQEADPANGICCPVYQCKVQCEYCVKINIHFLVSPSDTDVVYNATISAPSLGACYPSSLINSVGTVVSFGTATCTNNQGQNQTFCLCAAGTGYLSPPGGQKFNT